jgi:hypothetical protein
MGLIGSIIIGGLIGLIVAPIIMDIVDMFRGSKGK